MWLAENLPPIVYVVALVWLAVRTGKAMEDYEK